MRRVLGGNATGCSMGCDNVMGSGKEYDCLGHCDGGAQLDACGMCWDAVDFPTKANRHRDACGVCFGGLRDRDTCGRSRACASQLLI